MLKSFLLSILLFAHAGCATRAKPEGAKYLSRPLIIGASVSAGAGTVGPGTRLSLRYTQGSNIQIFARGGTPGAKLAAGLNENLFSGVSSVIAVDFLFWDSTLEDPAPSFEALGKLLSLSQARGIPVVLGDVPELLRNGQPSRQRLNEMIRASCTLARHCQVLALDQLYTKLQREGTLEIRGRRYTQQEILPDGLHLSAPASEHIADLIFNDLQRAAGGKEVVSN